jgi:Fe-S-cluster containining protein
MPKVREWKDPDDGERRGSVPRRPAEDLKALASLFARTDRMLAQWSCAGSGECCQLSRTGLEPFLFPIEVRALEAALGAQARPWPAARADGACPFLDASGRRCSVYAARPFGCRTYFCSRLSAPRAYPNASVEALNAALTQLSDRLDEGAAPRAMSEIASKRAGRADERGDLTST